MFPCVQVTAVGASGRMMVSVRCRVGVDNRRRAGRVNAQHQKDPTQRVVRGEAHATSTAMNTTAQVNRPIFMINILFLVQTKRKNDSCRIFPSESRQWEKERGAEL